MGKHSVALYFEDETPTDMARWAAWAMTLPDAARRASDLTMRRPLIAVAAPFPDRHARLTKRDDELSGLKIMRIVVESATALARETARTIKVMLSGRPIGAINDDGPDGALVSTLIEWQRAVDARAPDEPDWNQSGRVSVWAGVLSRSDADPHFAETYGTDGPISSFAKSLGILSYDHDLLEREHIREPAPLASLVAKFSFADSFIDRLPEPERAVTAVAVLYDADFSMRARDVADGRLRFIGSFSYKHATAGTPH